MSRLCLALGVAAAVSFSATAGNQAPVASRVCPPPSARLQVTPASALPVARLTVARCVQYDLDQGRWADADVRLVSARSVQPGLPVADRLPWLALIVRLEAARRVDVGPWSALVDLVLPDEEVLPWVGPLIRWGGRGAQLMGPAGR